MAVVDVSLPRAHTAVFPDRCVVCGRVSPGSHARLVTGTDGWWTLLGWWFAKLFVVKAPACKWCAWRLHARRFISLSVTIAICGGALWLIWPYCKTFLPRGLRSVVALGFGIVCLVPQFMFEFFFAKALHVEAKTDSVTYEFASRDYASDFAMLNRDAAWVKFEGETISEKSKAVAKGVVYTSDGSYSFLELADRASGGTP